MKELYYGIVLCVDRSRKYTFYSKIWVFCHEIQNLADYGWFLENLGEMADSKNRWSNWVLLIFLHHQMHNVQLLLRYRSLFSWMLKIGCLWLIFRIPNILKISQNQPKPYKTAKTDQVQQKRADSPTITRNSKEIDRCQQQHCKRTTTI